MSATASACPSCGTKPSRENARFCDGCGSQITSPVASAEYKQVTVLFADVVRSMDLAATLDPERLRDIMSAVFHSRPRWCSVTVAPSTSSPVTESWPCSAHR